jgi:hypothetical protein
MEEKMQAKADDSNVIAQSRVVLDDFWEPNSFALPTRGLMGCTGTKSPQRRICIH